MRMFAYMGMLQQSNNQHDITLTCLRCLFYWGLKEQTMKALLWLRGRFLETPGDSPGPVSIFFSRSCIYLLANGTYWCIT